MVGTGGEGGGPPASSPCPAAHLCKCGHPLHSPGYTHSCCPLGTRPGVRRVGHTQASALSPGATPHIQVSGYPPGPLLGPLPPECAAGAPTGVCMCIQVGRVSTRTRPTYPAAPRSVAQSSPHRRSRSQSPPGHHHSGHGRYSCRLGRGTSSRGWCWYVGQGRGAGWSRVGAGQPTLAKGPKGTWGTELTCCPSKPQMAPTFPAAAHAIHTIAMVTAGAAGTTRAS